MAGGVHKLAAREEAAATPASLLGLLTDVLRLQESGNLLDYLLDPVLAIVAWGVAIRELVRRVRSRQRRANVAPEGVTIPV